MMTIDRRSTTQTTMIRLLGLIGLLFLSSAMAPATVPPELSRIETFGLRGVELARLQIERGLPKGLEARAPMDQSIESLRMLVKQADDDRIAAVLPEVEELERLVGTRNGKAARSYTRALIRDLEPIALYIQRQRGIPASVLLAQIIVESGWGGSNVTITKNNVLGLGVAGQDEEFAVEIDLGRDRRRIHVRRYEETRAFGFETIGDCILYYVYVLLESPDNAKQYDGLRRFLDERGKGPIDDACRLRVLRLIAENYADDAEGYVEALLPLVERLKGIDAKAR